MAQQQMSVSAYPRWQQPPQRPAVPYCPPGILDSALVESGSRFHSQRFVVAMWNVKTGTTTKDLNTELINIDFDSMVLPIVCDELEGAFLL